MDKVIRKDLFVILTGGNPVDEKKKDLHFVNACLIILRISDRMQA